MLAAVLAAGNMAFAQNAQSQDTTKKEQLDQILIKAVRVGANSPITHTNLDKKEIAKRNLGQDIPILLNYLPSVVSTSDAGAGIGYTGLRIRGVSSQSTNVTINGIPYSDAESLGTFWVNLGDIASSLESLQVQRGVGTSTNGSAAFGASINLQTDIVAQGAAGEISNSYGSFNTRKHTVKFSTGLMQDRFELAGRLSNIVSDGFIDRASSNLKSYFLQGAYKDDKTLIKAIAFGGNERTYQSWFGFDPAAIAAIGENPDVRQNSRFNIGGIQYDDAGNRTGFYENQVDNYAQDHFQLHWTQRLNSNWSTNLGLNYTYGRGFFEEYVDDFHYQNNLFSGDSTFDFLGLNPITVNGTVVESMDYARRRWLDNDFYVVNATVNYKDNQLDAIFGSSISHYFGDHFGEVIWAQYANQFELGDRYYEGTGQKNDVSAFAKATYKLNDAFQLYGDLQLRNVNYATAGLNSDIVPFIVDKNFTFFNPKAGVTYALNSTDSFYASYARANREPNRDDFENNPDVRPEILDDLELGWRYRKNNTRFNANLYYMHYQDQLVLTGAINNVGAPIRENSGKSYRLGLELDAVVPITPWFTMQPNLTLSNNRNIDFVRDFDGSLQQLGNTQIAFSPNVVAANAAVFAPVENLQISLLSKYVGSQFMGNTQARLSQLDAYFLQDVNLVYTIKPKNTFKSITINAMLNNIFDTFYISNGYYYTFDDDFSNPGTISTVEGVGFYPQAGFNFLAGITLNF